MAEGGKGLLLTSQRGQTHLLGPVGLHLPTPSSPGKLSPCPSWDVSSRPPGAGAAASVRGRTQSPSPHNLLRGFLDPLLHSRGEGHQGGLWWAGRGIARKPASSSLCLGQDVPFFSQSYLLIYQCTPPLSLSATPLVVIIVTLLPTRPHGTVGPAVCLHRQNPDGKLLRPSAWPPFADEKTKAHKEKAPARPHSWLVGKSTQTEKEVPQ